ncbi:MAG: hypothetical protein EBS10_04290 [Acidimicrobiia bacterium]|nr:hypothetical protein [Acidimicrobiia bacterium]NCW49475.1 hypothetical protein [Actinomycetota bacterium]
MSSSAGSSAGSDAGSDAESAAGSAAGSLSSDPPQAETTRPAVASTAPSLRNGRWEDDDLM